MNEGIDHLAEFRARLAAREAAIDIHPEETWRPTALELFFRAIYREKLDGRKLAALPDAYRIDKNGKRELEHGEDTFWLGYFADTTEEHKTANTALARVVKSMEADKWLEIIKTANEEDYQFILRALHINPQKKPRVKPSPPPPREPRRKRKN